MGHCTGGWTAGVGGEEWGSWSYLVAEAQLQALVKEAKLWALVEEVDRWSPRRDGRVLVLCCGRGRRAVNKLVFI